MAEDKRQWTSEPSTRAKANTKVNTTKAKVKENKERATATKGTTTTALACGYGIGKGKYTTPIGYGNPFSGKGNYNQRRKGKGKGGKGKGKGKTTQGCYRCGQQGHMARDCTVPVYILNTHETAHEQQADATDYWYQQQQHYDPTWWHYDASAGATASQASQLALPAPTAQQMDSTPTIHVVSGVELVVAAVNEQEAHDNSQHQQTHRHEQHDGLVNLMVDSGAATHVCPLWFGNSFPLHRLQRGEGPQLRTVTDDNIQLHGYRWIYMHNTHGHPIAIPFYMCDVQQPILSVIRLAEQGFHINFNDNPPITHSKGFASSLKQKDGLYFLQHGSCRYPTTWS